MLPPFYAELPIPSEWGFSERFWTSVYLLEDLPAALLPEVQYEISCLLEDPDTETFLVDFYDPETNEIFLKRLDKH